MRQFLFVAAAIAPMAASALAADLPRSSVAPAFVLPALNWTGFYVGGQLGYQWGSSTRTSYNSAGAFSAVEPSISPSGVLGGAHIGYNYQINQFVIGIEGDADGTGYTQPGLNNSGNVKTTISMPFEASARARVGYAWDHYLIYATGGGAYSSIETNVINTITSGTDSFKTNRVNWTVGGGVEYAIDNNWSVRGEYRYTDRGNVTTLNTNSTINFINGPYTNRRHDSDNSLRFGFSYKFNAYAPPPAIIAKY